MPNIDTQAIQAVRNKYLGAVASRTLVPTNFVAANKQSMSRTAHFARDHINGLQIALPNFYVDTDGLEKGTGGVAQFTLSVEYPAGVFTQFTFGGQVTGNAPSGTILWSDFMRIVIPQGKQFWTKIWRADASGLLYTANANFKKNNAGLGDALNFSTTTVPDATMTTVATNLDPSNMYSPVALIGYTRKGSVLIFGDSIAIGVNDTPDATGSTGLFRWVEDSRGIINLGRSGELCTTFELNSVLRRSLGQYATDIIIEYTINDLNIGGKSAAEVITSLTNIGNTLRAAYPFKRLYLSTTIPNTNSGNTAVGGNEAKRLTVNAWKRTVPAPFDGIVETSDAIEAVGRTGLFASNTYADGLHPTQAGYQAVVASGFVNANIFDF